MKRTLVLDSEERALVVKALRLALGEISDGLSNLSKNEREGMTELLTAMSNTWEEG